MEYSVLLPVFRPDEYFPLALASIAKDIDAHGELVILDDGNAPPLEMRTPLSCSWRILRLPINGGIARALNVGLTHTQSPFILRMDADDLVLPGRCRTLVDYLKQHEDIALVSSWIEEMDFGERSLGQKVMLLDDLPIKHELILQNAIYHACAAFRREAVLQVGGYPEAYPYAEDYALWLQLAGQFRFANLPHVWYRVRVRSSSNTRSAGNRMQEEHLQLQKENLARLLAEEQIWNTYFPPVVFMDKVEEWAPQTCHNPLTRARYAHILYRLGLLFCKINRPLLSQRLFALSWALSPGQARVPLLKILCRYLPSFTKRYLLRQELF